MTQEKAAQLAAAFRQQFGGEVEAHPGDDGEKGRFDFSVVSSGFIGMSNLQRQDAVWETIERTLSREETLDVGMVWTFAPGEVDEWIRGLA